ncbi:MAG: hypothetical protein GF398_13310 [Chitinivibrionales bacterium]|nr:hypothetical protein [Chitinivibrionales bacterium]
MNALSRRPGDCGTSVAFEELEPYEWKLSCPVLRGERGREASDLPGFEICICCGRKGKHNFGGAGRTRQTGMRTKGVRLR